MAIKTKIGEGSCLVCQREVVWKKADGRALSCTCQHCDAQVYAKHGTEAERVIRAIIGAPEAPKPAPAAPAKPAAPKAEPAGAFGGFGL